MQCSAWCSAARCMVHGAVQCCCGCPGAPPPRGPRAPVAPTLTQPAPAFPPLPPHSSASAAAFLLQLAERRAALRGRQDQVQYLVKWRGYEADPEAENWLGVDEMADVRGCCWAALVGVLW